VCVCVCVCVYGCPVWYPGQNKRIAPLSFFQEYRKRRLQYLQHSHLRWTAIRRRWAYHHVCSISLSRHFGKTHATSRIIYLRCLRYLSGDKAWMICMYVWVWLCAWTKSANAAGTNGSTCLPKYRGVDSLAVSALAVRSWKPSNVDRSSHAWPKK
jgi:hypothetical protein